MYSKIKNWIYRIIGRAGEGDKQSKAFDIFIITLVTLNVIAIILDSFQDLSLRYSLAFRIFEIFSVSIFTVEYILRLWVCNVGKKYKGFFKGRIKYMFTPLALVDLMAILPFYIPMIIPIDLRFLKVLKLIRIFRLLKFGRYFETFHMLGRVIRKKKVELLITIFVVILLIIVSSGLIYELECEVQPESFSNIPRAMWWAVVTLTTVGNGDVYPITTLGKVLSAVVSFFGIALFAIPAGIISSGMISEIREKNKKDIICPKCGRVVKRINNFE